MILVDQGLAYKDLTIVPAAISRIEHRKECNIFYEDGMLPIFASPMMTVVNEFNYKIYEQNKVHPIIPRTVKYLTRLTFMNEEYWTAFSLSEFNKLFIDGINDFTPKNGRTYNVCIDMANGHMKLLYELTYKAKSNARKNNYTLNIMVGNIANPDTYKWICYNRYNCNIFILTKIASSNKISMINNFTLPFFIFTKSSYNHCFI
jgi:hypothetical protein